MRQPIQDVSAQSLAAHAPARPHTGYRRRRAAVAGLIGIITAVNGAIIIWLWLQNGGITSVHMVADVFTTLGRITGLLGAYLLLIQVLLLARLPFVERSAGFDHLTIWHRLNGKICLYLVLAHVVLITVGYAGTDRISIPLEITNLLTGYPGMVTATIGTGLMIVIVITSLVIVRRRLRYEAWYLVHLMAYAAILLGWFHQIPTGNEFVTDRIAATYWTALYAVTLALLILFRLIQPVTRGLWHQMRVAEVTFESITTVSLHITGRHLDHLHAHAGQFFLWRFVTGDRWWESHPFSLSQAPDGHSFRITVKASGDFSARAGTIPVGTAVLAEGPFGIFTDVVRQRERVALIAGGIGITPIRALAEEMQGDIVLVYRALLGTDIVFRRELDDLARVRGITIHYVLGDHRAPGGEHLMSPEHLRQLIPDIADREVYVCGPTALARYLTQNVRLVGVPQRYIHSEQFAL